MLFLLERAGVSFRLRRLTLAFATGLVCQAFAPFQSFAAEPTNYPLTIQNCGAPVTFDKAPQRIVSIGQSSTEILLSLGLGDRIVGTALWFAPVLKQFESENARIKRLADNDPSFEAVVAEEPDLVMAQFVGHLGPNGVVGRPEQFSKLGIRTYVAPADCAKDNSGGGDGARKAPFNMDHVYREIRELAQILDVNERGEALIASLRKREEEAVASVAGEKANDVSVVVWFSSPEAKGDAFVAGRNGVPAYILRTLGTRNIIATDEEWPLTNWESIVAANPTVIVMAEMDRRRYAADDPAVKRDFLETDPVVGKLEAVRNKRLILMDVEAMHASIRAVDGIEALARGIKSFGLAH